MTQQPNPETITINQEEIPTSERPRRELKPLTHRLPPAQLAAIARCLIDPAEQATQNHRGNRDKNHEGRKRPPPNSKETPMTNIEATSQNGSQSQAVPPAVPQHQDPQYAAAMHHIAAIPYKTVALKGLLWGAVAGTAGTLCVIGVKAVVARFTKPADDEFLG